MRRFKLRNATGAEFDLMRKDAFLHDPGGLGWSLEPTLHRVGTGCIVTDEIPAQPVPTGIIAFSGYDAYQEFLEFCQVGELVLCYRPASVWRYLDCFVTVDKPDIESASRRLLCSVSFTGAGQWYEEVRAYQASGTENGGKVYGYRYPYTYVSGAGGSVTVYNGALTSFCRMTILGPATNPSWAQYHRGEKVADGALNLTLPEGHKLVIDSHPATMEIAEYTVAGELVANRYGSSDFSTRRLLELLPGENVVAFLQEGTGTVTAFVEVRKRV